LVAAGSVSTGLGAARLVAADLLAADLLVEGPMAVGLLLVESLGMGLTTMMVPLVEEARAKVQVRT